MDIPIKKKKFSQQKIVMAVGAILLISFVLYLSMSFGGSSTLNIDTERIMVSTVKTGPLQENIPANGTVLPITIFYKQSINKKRSTGQRFYM